MISRFNVCREMEIALSKINLPECENSFIIKFAVILKGGMDNIVYIFVSLIEIKNHVAESDGACYYMFNLDLVFSLFRHSRREVKIIYDQCGSRTMLSCT